MYRTHLASDEGMLFKFPYSQQAGFWGQNTYIPLDVAFIDNGKVLDIQSITPMSTRIIRSASMCSMAVETNAGFFSQHRIKPGASVNVDLENREITFNVENN